MARGECLPCAVAVSEGLMLTLHDGLLPEVNRVGPLFLTIPPLWGIIERTLAQWRGSEEGWDVFLLYFLRYREVHAGGIGH